MTTQPEPDKTGAYSPADGRRRGLKSCVPVFRFIEKKSPRGSKTFVFEKDFPKGVGKVVEVTFEDFVLLPDESESRLVRVTNWESISRQEVSDEV